MKPSPLRNVSLPIIKSRRPTLAPCVFLCLTACSCLALWLLFVLKPPHLKVVKHPGENELYANNQPFNSTRKISESFLAIVQNATTIPSHSLTAVLPVTSVSLQILHGVLQSFLRSPSQLSEIILTCSESILADARQVVRQMVSSSDGYRCPEFSLRPWIPGMDQNIAVLHIAARYVTTEWVLLLDEGGLRDLDKRTAEMLVAPVAIQIPYGPAGFVFSALNASRITPSATPQAASFLVPPFVMPSAQLRGNLGFSKSDVWAALGSRISDSRLDMVGGIVVGSGAMVSHWNPTELGSTSLADVVDGYTTTNEDSPRENSLYISGNHSGIFTVLLPFFRSLHLFSSVVCHLRSDGHTVRVLIYLEDFDFQDVLNGSNGALTSGGCTLDYDTIIPEHGPLPVTMGRGESLISHWMDTFDGLPDVVVSIAENDRITADLGLFLDETDHKASLVRIPEADLPYCHWMSSLSLEEWRNWNIPQIDVSIITKDRPRSLGRLLSSLSNSIFFGDTLNLRVNLEQSADTETKELVERFRWSHGGMFVHHRIIHGGLLPAIVESWYPHSNDTYGLLLEDDVELSALFYAWVKMSILRYRYGAKSNKSPQLFGISLYQQKNLELRPEGRTPFDARALFSDHGLASPSTPYLSQIPCSWGAVYFPEHWREFHDYLAFRFSEMSMGIDTIVVPDVRSNKWTKSWKKFFIELVYLRGYVMLYPNYKDFVSLSTNHLEVGSHVKDRSKEKKDMFLLPLMKIPDNSSSDIEPTGLLDLPGGTLPSWNALPALNLTGSLTSLEELVDQGMRRRTALTECSDVVSSEYDAHLSLPFVSWSDLDTFKDVVLVESQDPDSLRTVFNSYKSSVRKMPGYLSGFQQIVTALDR